MTHAESLAKVSQHYAKFGKQVSLVFESLIDDDERTTVAGLGISRGAAPANLVVECFYIQLLSTTYSL